MSESDASSTISNKRQWSDDANDADRMKILERRSFDSQDLFLPVNDDTGFYGLYDGFYGAETRRRPYPSYHVLVNSVEMAASSAGDGTKHTRQQCPLIRNFLSSIQKTADAIQPQDDVAIGSEMESQDSPEASDAQENEKVPALRPKLLIQAIDDPTKSQLTDAQHQRYLKYSKKKAITPMSTWKEFERNDFRNLKNLVDSEQRAYLLALYQFWESSYPQLLSKSSDDAVDDEDMMHQFTINHLHKDYIQHLYHNATTPGASCQVEEGNTFLYYPHPNRYDTKCCQQISLFSLDSSGGISGHNLIDSVSTILLDERILNLSPTSKDEFKTECDNKLYRSYVNVIPESFLTEMVGDIPVPCKHRTEQILCQDHSSLLNDEHVVNLAMKHNVSIVTTDTTLACFLQDPATASWSIPSHHRKMSNGESCIILDPPLPIVYSSSRDFQTQYFREGIYQWLENKAQARNRNTAESSSHQPPQDHIEAVPTPTTCYRVRYLLMTFPSQKSTRTIKGTVRMLVRVTDRLAIEDSDTTLTVHVNTKYFPERGHQIPSASDRALWILDHAFRSPSLKSRTVIASVNPRSCSLLGWNEIGIAHALTGNSEFADVVSGLKSNGRSELESAVCHPEYNFDFWKEDPIDKWKVLTHLVQAMLTIGKGHHLLCFPSRDIEHGLLVHSRKSVSVHTPAQGTTGGISIVDEIVEATGSPKNPAEFPSFFRPWKWNHPGQVPYTFPASSLNTKGSGAVGS